ncbi:hypothetical protein [Caulobacter sp.]|uniref:hypothetical protein n=1 Tax=Caulobacter sp. TaxID=78 RepID=UPI003BB1B34F
MSQLNLFQGERPSSERRPPDLDFIRKHLGKALRTAQAAERMPWPPSVAQGWRDRFPKLAADLPAEEAAVLIEAFRRELDRLGSVAA